MDLYGATSEVLTDIAIKGSTSSQTGDPSFALKHLLSFEFVIVMHVMKEVMGITNVLCHALQQKSQDIVNALTIVSTTKELIQKLREEKWKSHLDDVISFCESHNISVPEMSDTYIDILRSRRKKNTVKFEHHYRVDVFTAAIDHQLQELNSRFIESVTELLRLSAALDPRGSFKYFNVDDICKLAEKFYPLDFTNQEKIQLRLQLQHYVLDVPCHSHLKNVRSIYELCRGLQETEKSKIYPLIDRLLRLVLTLSVSTATSERAFSAMKIVKTRLRSKMDDDFLKSYLIVYIEREIVETFSTDTIIDDFSSMMDRRAQFIVRKE